jgi:hypothetical protein
VAETTVTREGGEDDGDSDVGMDEGEMQDDGDEQKPAQVRLPLKNKQPNFSFFSKETIFSFVFSICALCLFRCPFSVRIFSSFKSTNRHRHSDQESTNLEKAKNLCVTTARTSCCTHSTPTGRAFHLIFILIPSARIASE